MKPFNQSPKTGDFVDYLLLFHKIQGRILVFTCTYPQILTCIGIPAGMFRDLLSEFVRE